jgi:hypothetical protein
MPKETPRGRYKRYLYSNNINIPKSTKYYQLNNLKTNKNEIVIPERECTQNQAFNDYDQSLNSDHNQNQIKAISEMNPNSLVTLETLNEDEEESQSSNQHNHLNSDQDLDDDFCEVFSNAFEHQSQEEINKNDLACAYLTAFFSGRTSQTSLSDFLKLSNVTSTIKLPTSFNGLRDIIMSEKQILTHEKSWHCINCMKTFDKLNHRLQRTCSNCKTK